MPLFVSKLSPEQWAEVRRLRAEGATYAALASRFGVASSVIGTRARREAWGSRGTAGPPPAASKVRPASPATAATRRHLALRLFRIIEIQISMLELRMMSDLEAHKKALADGGPGPPAKDHRETFAALIESINHVTEMTSDPASIADGRRISVNPELTALSPDIDPAALAAASAKDALRTEIAERLEKLLPPA
jgi:transposase-like protein